MKKIALCALLSLTGCETYVPAQDVYYETAPTTVYTQPAATYIQPAAETAVYTRPSRRQFMLRNSLPPLWYI